MTIAAAAFAGMAARGHNAWWRYVAATPLALLLTMIFGLLLGLVLQALHVLPADLATQLTHPSNPGIFFAATGVLFATLLCAFALALRWVHDKRPMDVIGTWSWRPAAAGAGSWLIALVVLGGIDFLLAPGGFSLTANRQTLIVAAYALLALAPQTFAEEFIFRGYVTQGLLLATRRPLPAAVLSGMLFGLMHIPNGGPQAVSAALFGILLAIIAMRTGGIAFGFGLHLMNNWFGSAVLVSGGDVFSGLPGVVTQDTPGLMWWDTATNTLALFGLTLLVIRWPRPDAEPRPATT